MLGDEGNKLSVNKTTVMQLIEITDLINLYHRSNLLIFFHILQVHCFEGSTLNSEDA